MSRELLVGLATALLAIATTGAALWSSTPRRPPVPDAIELRVTESAAAPADPATSPNGPRTGAGQREANDRGGDDDDRPTRERQIDRAGDNGDDGRDDDDDDDDDDDEDEDNEDGD